MYLSDVKRHFCPQCKYGYVTKSDSVRSPAIKAIEPTCVDIFGNARNACVERLLVDVEDLLHSNYLE